MYNRETYSAAFVLSNHFYTTQILTRFLIKRSQTIIKKRRINAYLLFLWYKISCTITYCLPECVLQVLVNQSKVEPWLVGQKCASEPQTSGTPSISLYLKITYLGMNSKMIIHRGITFLNTPNKKHFSIH